MRVLITENQYNQILLESFTEDILKGIKDSETIITGMIENSENNFNFELEGLNTSNTNIGGLLNTVEEYIDEELENISEDEKKLLLTSLIAVFFSSDKDTIYKALIKIKDTDLVGPFKKVYNKALELKESFINYLNYLDVSGEPESYFFMIPFAPELLNTKIDIVFDDKLSNKLSLLSGLDFNKTKELVQKIIDSGTQSNRAK